MEVMLIRGDRELDEFMEMYDIKGVLRREETMASGRSDELFRALQAKGYPEDFCRELAYRQLNTDYTATRMLGYLYRVSQPRIEDVVDEMLAIISDRDRLIEKHELERAQAKINRIYNYGLNAEDE